MRISRKPAAFPLLAALACSLLILTFAAAERGPAGTPAGALALAESPDGECFTVLVGRKASADGSVMVAHNEDDRGDIVVNLRKIAARDYGAPRKVDLGKGGFYETDGKTAGFLWIEATTQEFADSFVNEHGVLVTSDSCPSRITAEDLTDGGIGWMLRRLLAEKATSAREAVRLAGELVERFGYRASGRTYSIADKDEAWMLAAPSRPALGRPARPGRRGGRHPQPLHHPRDPDGRSRSFHGQPRPRRIRQNERLVRRGEGRAVRFQEGVRTAFDPRARRRRQRPAPLARTRAYHREALGTRPRLSFLGRSPGKRVTPEALMAILRDHYEGTEYDATDGYKTGTPNRTKFRTICTASTINAFVVSLGGKRPEPLSTAIWLAMGKPDTTVFLPLYYGISALPAGAGFGPVTHDYGLFYTQHFEDAEVKAAKDTLLNTKVLALEKAAEADYGPMREKLVKELFPAEMAFVKAGPKFEKEFAVLYAKNKARALKKLDDYVAAAFEKATKIPRRSPRRPRNSLSGQPRHLAPAAWSILAISLLLTFLAYQSAVLFFSPLALTSAFFSTRSLTMSACSVQAALISGVRPVAFLASTSAPASTSIRAISGLKR